MIDLMNLNASEEEVGFETIPIGVSGADENDNIRITQKALNEVKKIKTQNSIPDDYGLRVGVKGGGCSGMSYTLGFDASEKELDRVYETQGVRVFIDPKSLFYLMGVTLVMTTAIQPDLHRFFRCIAWDTSLCHRAYMQEDFAVSSPPSNSISAPPSAIAV